ncbi:hypothetical protein Tco_0823900 [Tanacetum coccineum]|uniref:Uncharacterized protein n=1 Tax=Tanacetum coccineum TaxID=301880 RepID=A0ABQ5ANA0_9ASTR
MGGGFITAFHTYCAEYSSIAEDNDWTPSHESREPPQRDMADTLGRSAGQVFPKLIKSVTCDCTIGNGAIRGTSTTLRPKNMSLDVEEIPNVNGSIRNTANREEGIPRDFPTSLVTPSVMQELCEKHYAQILLFMAKRGIMRN